MTSRRKGFGKQTYILKNVIRSVLIDEKLEKMHLKRQSR